LSIIHEKQALPIIVLNQPWQDSQDFILHSGQISLEKRKERKLIGSISANSFSDCKEYRVQCDLKESHLHVIFPYIYT
jgi:hypothetical protein